MDNKDNNDMNIPINILNKNQFSSYSQFDADIDPSKEDEACLLRSGLIYPSNPALLPQKYSHLISPSIQHRHFQSNFYDEFHKKLYHCYLCTEPYLNQYSLQKHLKMRHFISFNDQIYNPIPKWYCRVCHKEFTYKPIGSGNKSVIKHYCSNKSKQLQIDKINNIHSNVKLCVINHNDALNIKRIRYECRINNTLSQIEHWLKNQLFKSKLTRTDYLNSSKMFIAVQGFTCAIQLLQKSQNIMHNSKNNKNNLIQFNDANTNEDIEQTLIDVAKKLKNQSK